MHQLDKMLLVDDWSKFPVKTCSRAERKADTYILCTVCTDLILKIFPIPLRVHDPPPSYRKPKNIKSQIKIIKMVRSNSGQSELFFFIKKRFFFFLTKTTLTNTYTRIKTVISFYCHYRCFSS